MCLLGTLRKVEKHQRKVAEAQKRQQLLPIFVVMLISLGFDFPTTLVFVVTTTTHPQVRNRLDFLCV